MGGGEGYEMRNSERSSRERLAGLVNLFKDGGQVFSRRVEGEKLRKGGALCGSDAYTSSL